MGSSSGWRLPSGQQLFIVTLAVTNMIVFHGNKVVENVWNMHRVCRMEAVLQSDLLDTTIYQTKYSN